MSRPRGQSPATSATSSESNKQGWRMKNRLVRALAVFVLVAAVAAPLAAQGKKNKEDLTRRHVEGLVTDASDQPVNGAVVQLKDMRSLAVRSFITREGGKYSFYNLDVNIDYELRAEHNGVSSPTRTLSVFDTRRSPVINLKLEKK
jgi:hypothetical protein